ncbi:MAG TPA: hypothetical protein VKH20_05260 [Solirubrobacterales bacterium]|nr:hypothetical protein [Solirubrobacterales bacterium]
MSFGRRLAATYADIWRTYWGWMPSLLIFAGLVFVPLSLLDALSLQIDVDSLDLTSGIKIAALVLAVGAVTMTRLLIEIEERSAVGALRRSVQLVRGSFWLVLWVLLPIEILGDAIGGGLAGLVHRELGDTFLASWLAEAIANSFLSPIFAVAAVLLTVELIARNEGTAPPPHAAPAPA